MTTPIETDMLARTYNSNQRKTRAKMTVLNSRRRRYSYLIPCPQTAENINLRYISTFHPYVHGVHFFRKVHTHTRTQNVQPPYVMECNVCESKIRCRSKIMYTHILNNYNKIATHALTMSRNWSLDTSLFEPHHPGLLPRNMGVTLCATTTCVNMLRRRFHHLFGGISRVKYHIHKKNIM